MAPSAAGPGTGPSSSSSLSSSSQAIQIPHPHPEYAQRRRGGRYSKIPSPVSRTSSQAGPSSSSLSSSSDWSSPPGSQAQSGTSIPYNTKDPHLPPSRNTPSTPQRKDKGPAVSSGPLTPLFPPSTSPLSPSMLASSSYTSVNLNSHVDDPDEPPRLITYTKHGQGFTWNDELFLPSYMIGRHGGSRGGKKKMYDGDFGDDEAVSVVDIFVTDEEAAAMMP